MPMRSGARDIPSPFSPGDGPAPLEVDELDKPATAPASPRPSTWVPQHVVRSPTPHPWEAQPVGALQHCSYGRVNARAASGIPERGRDVGAQVRSERLHGARRFEPPSGHLSSAYSHAAADSRRPYEPPPVGRKREKPVNYRCSSRPMGRIAPSLWISRSAHGPTRNVAV